LTYWELSFHLFLELERWAEIVGEKTPCVFVEVVDVSDQIWLVKPVATQGLTHVCPVFLLDEGVVVLLVRTVARENDRVLWLVIKIPEQMVVEKLGAVVTVKA
jgi:hypothetical protein